jgi:hypothetical protein
MKTAVLITNWRASNSEVPVRQLRRRSRPHILLGGCQMRQVKSSNRGASETPRPMEQATARPNRANSKTMKKNQSRHQTKTATRQEYQARPTEEQIAARARIIYEESGCLAGHDLDNWTRAEAELLQQCDRQVGATPGARA